jgi:hypothetical protein
MRRSAALLGLLLVLPATGRAACGTVNLPSGTQLTAVAVNTALNAALASCSAGVTSLSASGITANAQLGSVALPANGSLGPMMVIDETGGQPATVSIGTTLGASDVVPTQPPVPANGSLTVDITAFSKGWFSGTTPQLLYVTTSGGGSSLHVTLYYVVP